jgi:hypothetical protein
LPALGFCDESDPPFKGTLAWIHAPQREHNFSDKPFGLPGNQRLPFTPCWTVADHLRLKSHQATVIEMLRRAGWDAGIVSEGLDPDTGMDVGGGSAFATAAGYVAFTALDVLRSGSPHKLAKTTALDVSKKRRIGVGKRRKVRRRG